MLHFSFPYPHPLIALILIENAIMNNVKRLRYRDIWPLSFLNALEWICGWCSHQVGFFFFFCRECWTNNICHVRACGWNSLEGGKEKCLEWGEMTIWAIVEKRIEWCCWKAPTSGKLKFISKLESVKLDWGRLFNWSQINVPITF